jgi:exodeoxyribonuclease V alpha subunit
MLRDLQEQGSLQAIDRQFAELVGRVTGSDNRWLLLSAALASRAVGRGDICLDLAASAGQPFPDTATEPAGEDRAETPAPRQIDLPALDPWIAALRTKPARLCVGDAGANRPLVLDGTRLYLRRFWNYEQSVVAGLCARAGTADETARSPAFERLLKQYFPDTPGPGAGLQREAARKACSRRLAFISGGPGTGKTFTVARIVALLAGQRPREMPLKVHLAAPTGKAAARMKESIVRAKGDFGGAASVAGQIPEEASTLHRLLGSLPGSPYFRHDRTRPLDTDVVVVDEASMIDLPLMAKLLDALPPQARLILVGDMDQLASVEPGKVFGDICEAAASNPVLSPCMTKLTYSRRFKPDSPIGRLSAAINNARPDNLADAGEAWQTLADADGDTLRRYEAAGGLRDGAGHPLHGFRTAVLSGYRDFLNAATPAGAFEAMNGFRVLCAVRGGPYGVRAVNRTIEEILALRGVGAIAPELRPRRPLAPSGEFYDHRLILVTVNDYALGLYNGDIGVVLADPESGVLSAWFEREIQGDAAPYRRIAVNMLPDHETAFAMTVHKSQGSEFGRVVFVLPPDTDSPVLTRELLYTGLTRTQGPLDLWCAEAAFKAAVLRRTRRTSGLKERLGRLQGNTARAASRPTRRKAD